MHMTSTQDLTAALAPIVDSAGLYLEHVKVTRAGKRSVVAVVVDLPDGPGAVSSDQLGDVSRSISAAMDTIKEAPSGAYTLEVTTPGVTRDLTDLRHFRRAEGRLVTLTLSDGSAASGRIAAVEGDNREGATIDLQTDSGTETLALSEVTTGRMDIEFSR